MSQGKTQQLATETGDMTHAVTDSHGFKRPHGWQAAAVDRLMADGIPRTVADVAHELGISKDRAGEAIKNRIYTKAYREVAEGRRMMHPKGYMFTAKLYGINPDGGSKRRSTKASLAEYQAECAAGESSSSVARALARRSPLELAWAAA